MFLNDYFLKSAHPVYAAQFLLSAPKLRILNMKSILCFGDSNTWGYIPHLKHTLKARYPLTIRWPGLLQTLLGSQFHIIEEGLNSRTTNLDYALPPDRNGKTYLAPCLYSHSPLDLVILALGGNDTKTYFNRSAEQIKNGLAELIQIIQTSPYGSDMIQPPKILITTCPIPLPFIEEFEDEQGVKFLTGAVKKSQDLVGLYAKLADQTGCYYLDLSRESFPQKLTVFITTKLLIKNVRKCWR